MKTWLIVLYKNGPSHDQFLFYGQCDQIGRFLKVLGNKITSEGSINDCQLFGLFWKTSLLFKTLKLHWLRFGQLLEKLGYFLLQHLVTLFMAHSNGLRETGQWCGSVGRAFASNIRDPRLESSHQQFFFTINCIDIVSKRRRIKKEVGNGHQKTF